MKNDKKVFDWLSGHYVFARENIKMHEAMPKALPLVIGQQQQNCTVSTIIT